MKKHTPGPWTTNYLPHDVWAASGEHICTTNMHHIASIIDEDAANARLISAAPEMLQALEVVRDLLIGNGVAVHAPLTMERINKAIFKATGGVA